MRKPFQSWLYQGPDLKTALRDGKSSAYFEGWYFKHSFENGRSIAFIVGVSLGKNAHGFIQIIDSSLGSDYLSFTLETVTLQRNSLDIRMGGNHFSDTGMHIDLSSAIGRIKVNVSFHDRIRPISSLYVPGIMGPFSYIPRMQCYHALVSVHHRLQGRFEINGEALDIDGARGYIEKDWGTSFPIAWIWMQANHFTDEASFMLSTAHIPWGPLSFPGHLGFFYHREYANPPVVFGTYKGFKIRKIEKLRKADDTIVQAVISDRSRELKISATYREAMELTAPVNGDMTRSIKETVQGHIHLTFSHAGKVLFDSKSGSAGIEIQGPVERYIL